MTTPFPYVINVPEILNPNLNLSGSSPRVTRVNSHLESLKQLRMILKTVPVQDFYYLAHIFLNRLYKLSSESLGFLRLFRFSKTLK